LRLGKVGIDSLLMHSEESREITTPALPMRFEMLECESEEMKGYFENGR
jgi:hypothetical protein